MRDAVEEFLDVKVKHPVLLPAAPSGHGQRVMGRTTRTIAVTVGVEDRLKLLLQQHCCRGLGHSVRCIGHPEDPDPRPMILRYLHCPHRPREIASRGHPIPQPVKVVPFPGTELFDADSVHARRTVVGPDLLPRPKHQALGDSKRLHLLLGSRPSLLPRRVGVGLTLICPAPLLQPHYRTFIATTGRSAPVPRIGTLPLTVAPVWGPPSCRPSGCTSPPQRPDRYRDDRFSCSMPAPTTSSRHLYTGHRRASTQATSRLRAHPHGRAFIPGTPDNPGFDAIVLFFRCVSSGSHMFVFSSHT